MYVAVGRIGPRNRVLDKGAEIVGNFGQIARRIVCGIGHSDDTDSCKGFLVIIQDCLKKQDINE